MLDRDDELFRIEDDNGRLHLTHASGVYFSEESAQIAADHFLWEEEQQRKGIRPDPFAEARAAHG
jgi:hypothetical protein